MSINTFELKHIEVYLTPFGVVTLALSELLYSINIEVKGIYDNNVDIQGKTYRSIPIEPFPSSIIQEKKDCCVIICNYMYERAIKAQLNTSGITNINLLSDLFVDGQLNQIALIDYANAIDYAAVRAIMPRYAGYEGAAALEIKKNLLPEFAMEESAFVLPHTNLIITERCTLRCKHCSSWMQYFKQPRDYDLCEIERGIDALFQLVDYTRDIHITGGEPCLYPQLSEVIDYVANTGKIGIINVLTNGTIIPDDGLCEKIAEKGAAVRISDYGKLSVKLRELSEKLERFKIPYAVMEDMVWYDYARYRKQPLQLNDVTQMYAACPLNCMALSGTFFSRCQIAMTAFSLKATPLDDTGCAFGDVINVTEIDKEVFKRYLTDNTPLQACRICTGKSRNTQRIPAAIQISSPPPYIRYDNGEDKDIGRLTCEKDTQ